jgi:hypothetical protein
LFRDWRKDRAASRRGAFPWLVALQEAIARFVEECDRSARPFVWTADSNAIAGEAHRGYHALASMEWHAC